MVAIVTGFNNNVIGNVQAFGANRVEFQKYEDRFGPGGPLNDEERRRRNLTVEDAEALRNEVPEAAAVSTLCAYDDAEVKVKNGNLVANNPYVLAADEFYPIATAYGVGEGRFFTSTEVAHNALVAVLGLRGGGGDLPERGPDRQGHHGERNAVPGGGRPGQEGGAVRLLARQQDRPAERDLRAPVRLPAPARRREALGRAEAERGPREGHREVASRSSGCAGRSPSTSRTTSRSSRPTSSSPSSAPSRAA